MVWPEVSSDPLAPPASTNKIGECEHRVQFYESDDYLLETLTEYFGNGLRDGAACIAIATKEHHDQLAERLTARGIDLPAARATGRFVALDAGEALARIMVGGAPDPYRFAEVVGTLLARAEAVGRPVRAFGEMVALLGAKGEWESAIQLEQLWVEQGRTHPFELLCAYPMRDFGANSRSAPFTRICNQHTRVVPAESYSGLASAEERLREIGQLQQKALMLEAEITRRKGTERELLRREEELADFLDNAIEGIHKVGPDGTILWANKAELDLLGYAPNEYVGHRIKEFHVDPEVGDEILGKLMAGDALYNFPARLRCKDGSTKHVLIHSNARWQDGKFRYSRCFTRDVTDRLRMEDEIERALASEQAARREAEAGNRAKDLFLSLLSHELRTPLSVILGWTYLLRRSAGDPAKVLEAVDIVEQNAHLQSELVSDLLDLSRIISGKLGLDLALVEMPLLVESVGKEIAPAAAAKGLAFTTAIEPVAEPVHGDYARLFQALRNLLLNAVKFTPAGGRVTLSLARTGNRVRIVVSDTGDGIAAELLAHVFDRFRRVDSPSARKHGGLGIGLAIAKELIEMHGGRLRAESEGEGKGATFVVELPLATGSVPGDADAQANGLSLPPTTKT